MKGQVSEACLGFIRWGKGRWVANYNIWPFYLDIITSFYLSSLSYCPSIPTLVWIINFFSRQQRVPIFAYQQGVPQGTILGLILSLKYSKIYKLFILTDPLNFTVSVLVKGTQYQTFWNKQIIVLLSKAGRRIHILQVCNKYGYSLDILHGLIIPLPTYGISMWGTASYKSGISF